NVAEPAAADAEDHRPVPLDQDAKGVRVTIVGVSAKQIGIRCRRSEVPAEVTENGGGGGHRRRSPGGDSTPREPGRPAMSRRFSPSARWTGSFRRAGRRNVA